MHTKRALLLRWQLMLPLYWMLQLYRLLLLLLLLLRMLLMLPWVMGAVKLVTTRVAACYQWPASARDWV